MRRKGWRFWLGFGATITMGPELREQWKAQWEEKTDMKLVEIKVIKVDGKTMNTNDYPLYVIEGSEDQMLNSAKKGMNVGDFIIFGGKTFRRVRGGFREASEADMAELLASQLGIEETLERMGLEHNS